MPRPTLLYWDCSQIASLAIFMTIPTFSEERALIKEGYRMIVGVDEVGCGALAGPVMAGAVVLPLNSKIAKLKDSKLLTPTSREALYPLVIERASAWAIGRAEVEEIAEHGLREATYMAMRRAIAQIDEVEFILVDAWTIPGLKIPQRGIVKGDRQVKSIAAASLVAKVTRDREMMVYAEQYPEYGFDAHKGYGTKAHRAAIKAHGPCPIHRLSYKTFQ